MTADAGSAARVGSRRLPVAAAVLAALALAGLASVAIHPVASRPASPSAAGAVKGLPGADSTAWFCAGPLPVGTPHEASSIAIANLRAAPVGAAVTIVLASGATSTEEVSIPARGESVVGLSHLHTPSVAAASVVADRPGVEVVELVHGALGPDVSPCSGQVAMTQYLAAGSTRAGNNLAIALYDPGSTPAVASVSFATPSGPQSPPALQGVPVPAGRVVVVYVAHSLPFRRFLSATVHASGGGVVAGALDVVENRGVTFEALESPVVSASTQWFFPAAPAGASAQQTFDLLNPGRRTADLEIRLGGPVGVGEITLSLAPGATTRYSPASDLSSAAVRWASVTSMNQVPIVAARELLVASPLRVRAPRAKKPAARRRLALHLLPTLPVGFAITSGATSSADSWVLGGGQSDARISEFVTVANPSGRSATVWIRPLTGSFAGLGPVRVAAHGSVVVNLADLPAASGRLSLQVTSNVGVVASGELYTRGSTGSPGLAAPAAFPAG